MLGFSKFGADEGTRLVCGQGVPPVLTVHWTVIHCRLPFESPSDDEQRKPCFEKQGFLRWCGRMENVRT